MPNSYAATNTKKFLDADGLAYFSRKLNDYPTNDVIAAVIDGVQDALDEKLDSNKVGVASGVASLDAEGKVPSSQLPTDANTTYTLTQNSTDGHIITLTPSTGSPMSVTIPDNNTIYENATTTEAGLMSPSDKIKLNGVETGAQVNPGNATQSDAGLMSAEDKAKLDGIATGATANIGTITGITMNGASKGSGGVVDLGTVITAHQDITGKADKTATVSTVEYDATNKKITKTINGTTTDIVSVASIKTDLNLAKGDVGLGNVENKSSATIRGEITSSDVTTALGYTPLNSSLKGANSGLAELDSTGKVPTSQLPSYVDDVLEYATKDAFPLTGESGKIYVNLADNKTYRWSGSEYVEISASLALGETASTAYAGNKGKVAYDHAQAKGSAYTSGLYKITTNTEGHVTAATAVVKADITGLGIPGSDTTYTLTQDASDGHKLTFTPSSGGATTITIPDNNTDVNVRQTLKGSTDNNNRPLLLSYSDSSSDTANVDNVAYRSNSIYANPSTGTVTATNFSGKVNNHTIGSDVPSFTSSDSGKFLIINSSGAIEAVTMTAWQGGAY